MAFRLNESELIRTVYESIPPSEIPHIVRSIPTIYVTRLLRFVANAADETPHLEFNLLWIQALLSIRGRYIKNNAASFAAELRSVQKAIDGIRNDLKRLAEKNSYTLEYFLSKPAYAPGAKNTTSNESKRMLLENPKEENPLMEEQGGDEANDSDGDWIGLE